MRRVRATAALRCAIFAVCAAPLLAALACDSGFWFFVGLGALVFEYPFELLAVGLAARSKRPLRSVWFVDLDAQQLRERDEFHESTRDNPTLR